MLLPLLVWPAVGRAADTVTLGPSLPTASPPGGGGLLCFSAPDCTYFTEGSMAFVAKAPAPDDPELVGRGVLSAMPSSVVLQPDGGGAYSIVAQSAEQFEPCTSNPNNNYCIPPSDAVYTFQTNLPIAAGQLIGIETINKPNCDNDNPIDCTIIGDVESGPQATGGQAYLDPTPALNTPTVPRSDSIRAVHSRRRRADQRADGVDRRWPAGGAASTWASPRRLIFR